MNRTLNHRIYTTKTAYIIIASDIANWDVNFHSKYCCWTAFQCTDTTGAQKLLQNAYTMHSSSHLRCMSFSEAQRPARPVTFGSIERAPLNRKTMSFICFAAFVLCIYIYALYLLCAYSAPKGTLSEFHHFLHNCVWFCILICPLSILLVYNAAPPLFLLSIALCVGQI